jgi:hypothetical protein
MELAVLQEQLMLVMEYAVRLVIVRMDSVVELTRLVGALL